jgi:hypothetical protein
LWIISDLKWKDFRKEQMMGMGKNENNKKWDKKMRQMKD